MDFTNGGTQLDVTPTNNPTAQRKVHVEKSSNHGGNHGGKWQRTGLIAALLAVVVLIVGLIIVISSSKKINPEDSYVNSSKLQAVFLNTGQVYFGNIQALNNRYFVLTNIYYLQTSSSSTTTASSAASNVSLVKLGCELHKPYDQMVINSAEVTFWENLQSSGQVAKAVTAFEKANPDGQKCSDQTAAASTTSGTATQSAATSTDTSAAASGDQ
jgi:hypothetical protein